MSERVIAHGSDFMVFERSGTEGSYTYKPIAGQRNVSLNREANYRESNAKNLGGYKDFFLGLKGWNASVEMEIPDYDDTNANELSYEDLEGYETAGTKATWLFCWITAMASTSATPAPDTTKPMWIGKGLVNCPLSAPTGDNATTSIAIQGCLELERVDPT